MAYPSESGEMTPELIRNAVNVLSKVPDCIQKLQRKQIATDKSLDAKNKRIQYLEKVCDEIH
jgi:hypothetical protein